MPTVEKKLIVVAPFEIERGYKTVSYKVNDEFKVPEDWARNADAEEFRKINRNEKGELNGIAFAVPKPVLDEKGKLKYMDSRLVILPLKEV